METMYSRIERILKEKGMNKRELADITKIPYSTLISAFNRKSQGFSVEYVGAIAEALGYKIDYLLYGDISEDLKFFRGDEFFHETGDGVDYVDQFAEGALIKNYRLLNSLGREVVKHIVSGMRYDAYFADQNKVEAYKRWLEEGKAKREPTNSDDSPVSSSRTENEP